MKRLLVSLLFVCLLCTLTIYPVTADTVTTETDTFGQLSSLDEKQCEEFLLSYGITIPEELSGIRIQELIADLEENPDMNLTANWDVLHNFLEDVRVAVKSYYGLTTATQPSTRYTLQYSTLHSWDSSTMPNYNCYAYALGRTTVCQPGAFSGGSYNGNADVNTLAYTIRNDLTEGLGYSCTYVSATLTTSGDWHNVIAVKKDTTFDHYGTNDYHVARRNGGNWYHKPGRTAVLKFNTPSAQVAVWTNENYNGVYNQGWVSYDSDLLYISYKTTHGGTTPVKTGEHYHMGASHYYQYANACIDCGEYLSTYYTSTPCSGPPCLIVTPTDASNKD